MAWKGQKLRTLVEEKEINVATLARDLNVSRASIYDWFDGQVPKGQHLVHLSSLLGVNPTHFFSDDTQKNITLPLHRTRGVAKVTENVREEALQLANRYEKLFKMSEAGLIQVLRIENIKSEQNARNLAQELRKISQIENGKPIDYEDVFQLQDKLGVIIIFRDFPTNIKSYAYYCKIHNHRVVFVDNKTNVIDLIFPLLHETVHALLDEKTPEIFQDQEEQFCDLVASYTQFPEEYIKTIAETIKGNRKDIMINKIKQFAADKHHAIFGLTKRLPNLDYRDFAGADGNLKKSFPNIGEILFQEKEPRDYVETLRMLTPRFVQMVTNQIENVSNRTIGEWLGLDNKIDAEVIIKELKR